MKNNKNKESDSFLLLSAALLAAHIAVIALACVFFALISLIENTTLRTIYFAALMALTMVVTIVMDAFYTRMVRRNNAAIKIQSIVSRVNTLAILWDTSYKVIMVNDAFENSTHYSKEDISDMETLKKILPERAFTMDLNDPAKLEEFIRCDFEPVTIQGRTGGSVKTVWSHLVITDVGIFSGSEAVILSLGANISEEDRMREELQSYSTKATDNEKLYHISVELSEIGMVIGSDKQSGFYATDSFRRMLGFPEDYEYVENKDIMERIHPDDKEALARVLMSAVSSPQMGQSARAQFRASDGKGNYHWYEMRFKHSKDDKGGYLSCGALINIDESKSRDELIERMAYFDELTQVYNRQRLMMLGNEIFKSASDEKNYWVVALDVDDFHIINDTCGYGTGDMLLKQVALILMRQAPNNSVIARIGGDNFAMIVPMGQGVENIAVLIADIQEEVAKVTELGLDNMNITCSAGYCVMHSDQNSDFTRALEHAEFALTLAGSTKSGIRRFDSRLNQAAITRSNIEKDLIAALDNNEFTLYYQPKIDLGTGDIIGMEALIRWIKPDGTIVPPMEFIPIAEGSMFITKLSRFVLHEACRQNKEWQDKGFPCMTVSVNLTAVDFYQSDITATITGVLEETGLDAKYLDIELTESMALKDINVAISQMNEMRKLGIKISMDDFGTGYSSLSYIQQLPITLLKLDRSFIMYLEDDKVSREIVSAVIRIAKSKNIETIAEGVESAGQVGILRDSGCDQGQGYFFGKPMTAQDFEQFMLMKKNAR